MKMCAFSSYFLKSCWLSVSWLGTCVPSPLVTALSVLTLSGWSPYCLPIPL